MANKEPAQPFQGKIPPNHIQAEQSVLGCAMTSERALAEITAILKIEDFPPTFCCESFIPTLLDSATGLFLILFKLFIGRIVF